MTIAPPALDVLSNVAKHKITEQEFMRLPSDGQKYELVCRSKKTAFVRVMIAASKFVVENRERVCPWE